MRITLCCLSYSSVGLGHSSCRTRAEGGEGKASPCSHGAAFWLFLQKQGSPHALTPDTHSLHGGDSWQELAKEPRLPSDSGYDNPRKVLTARGLSSGHSAHRGQTFQRIPVFLTDPHPAPSSSDPPRSWLGGHEERLFSALWKENEPQKPVRVSSVPADARQAGRQAVAITTNPQKP